MKTTNEFLDAVKAKHGLTSDYQLAKFLNIRPNRISNYRTGVSMFDEDTCLDIAETLELEGGYVMTCIAAERAKNDRVKKAWAWWAEHRGGLAAALALVAILPMVHIEGNDFNMAFFGLTASAGQSVYYVK